MAYQHHMYAFPTQGLKIWIVSASPPTEQHASFGLFRRNAIVSKPVVWYPISLHLLLCLLKLGFLEIIDKNVFIQHGKVYYDIQMVVRLLLSNSEGLVTLDCKSIPACHWNGLKLDGRFPSFLHPWYCKCHAIKMVSKNFIKHQTLSLPYICASFTSIGKCL